jgi:hypothetical protein
MCTYLIGSIILGDTMGYTDLAVHVPENISKPDFVIYPNPALSSFTVSSNSIEKNVRFEIFNIVGGKVFEDQFSEQQTIDVAGLPSGIYCISLHTENTTSVQKLIKQ